MSKYIQDKYDRMVNENENKFTSIHKNSVIEINFDDKIIIPVSINVCLTKKKYSVNLISYAKYIIDVLNDGFSGNINSDYKSNPIYTEEYFISQLLFKHGITNAKSYAKIIHSYINSSTNTNIQFYLASIEYYDMNYEADFSDLSTENLINDFSTKGFIINEKNQSNLNINIIKFNSSTLGIATFPWMKYLSEKIPNIMMVFIDYSTIHPNISINNFNQSRTLIHEVGHALGLKHSFGHDLTNIKIYQILIGLPMFKLYIDSTEKQIYPDIPYQKKPTLINPIQSGDYQIINNIPCNFACFMDYSPDILLTHFTQSQRNIMHVILNLYNPKLIILSKQLLTKNIIYLNIHFKYKKKTKHTIPANSYIIEFNSHNKYTIHQPILTNSIIILNKIIKQI